MALLLFFSMTLCLLTGSLIYSKSFSRYFFAKVFTILSAKTFMDELRCHDLRHIQGRVLEIGPGAGGNFRCWENSTSIISWDAIEVNKHFEPSLKLEYVRRNLSFPTRVNWIEENGSGIDIATGAYDVVVMTHVLCSIPNIQPVLHTIDRALKPGGTYYFLEHVASSPINSDHASLAFWQNLAAPILHIFGSGCQLKDTGALLEAAATDPNGTLKGYSLNMTRFLAEMMPTPMKPHVVGTLSKPFLPVA